MTDLVVSTILAHRKRVHIRRTVSPLVGIKNLGGGERTFNVKLP